MNLVSMHVLVQSAQMRNVTSRSKVHWKSFWTRQLRRAQCAVMQVCQQNCRILLVCCLLWVSTHCSCIAHCFLHTAPQWVSNNGGLSRAGVKASLGLSLCHRGLVDLCTSKLNTECAPHILPTAVMEMHANTNSSGPQNPRLALKDIVSLPSCIREHASRTVVATCMRRHG